MDAAPDAHVRFALDLLHALPPPAAGGVVSPWSISSALAVVADGCDRAARDEIEQVLGGSADGDVVERLATDATTLARRLGVGDAEAGSSGESRLAVANTLWVDGGRTPVAAFVGHLDRWPGAALRAAPLATDPERARREINSDVAGTTRGLIPDILPRGALTGEERAVVVNALYLLAAWIEPFAEGATVDEPFHAPSGARAVPTMRATCEAAYVGGDWQYLALPLHLGLRAEVLLPPDGAGPRALAPATLAACRAAAATHRVDLHLPRFRVESTLDVAPALRALGVRRAFEPGARALAVVEEERLHLAGAIHGAVLRVDERGVEGAAATALVARAVAFRQLPAVEMRVDRPFLVLVTHPATGAVIFLAEVAEP